MPLQTVCPFSLFHQKNRWEDAIQPYKSGSDFFKFSGLNLPAFITGYLKSCMILLTGEEGLRIAAQNVWGDAEGVGFLRLEKRKQRAGGTITYGPEVGTSLQKDAQWNDKKQQPEVEFGSKEGLLHQKVEKQAKKLPRNIVGETQNSARYSLRDLI